MSKKLNAAIIGSGNIGTDLLKNSNVPSGSSPFGWSGLIRILRGLRKQRHQV